MGLDLPRAIKPGQEMRGVSYMKRKVYAKLKSSPKGLRLAKKMNLESKNYGVAAQAAVEFFQDMVGIRSDGVVGPRTWHFLGVAASSLAPESLRGIPWEPGIRPFDGNWVPDAHYTRLKAARRKGWRGRVNSGYRPDWYQKKLFDAKVQEFVRAGYSLAAARVAAGKWVAPPGRSPHRHKDDRCAIDVTYSAQLGKVEPRWYQPMSWEPWHRQWRPAY